MENQNVVNVDLTNPQAPNATQQEVLPEEEIKQPAQPGSKTEPTELLKSLQEEREKRRLAEEKAKLVEEELDTIKSSVPSEQEAWSDEGKVLENKIKSLTSELSEVKGELTKKDILIANPMLKDMWQEFEDFRDDPENKGMNVRTAAKAFLTEKGLLEPKRKGLEASTSGPKATPSYGTMTSDEVKHLRENNFRKYQDMLKKDQIKISG